MPELRPDLLSYLGVTPPGPPMSQFFPQQGGDDAFRSQLEERPNPMAGLPPEMSMAYQTSDPSGFLGQVDKFRGDLQTQKAIKGVADLDFGSKDYSKSVASLISKYPRAAQNPAFLNIMKLKELSGSQSKDRNLNSQAAAAMKQFYSLDPSDPDYPEKHQKWVESLDPEVLADTRVDRLVQTGFNNAATQRARKTADQQANQALDKQLIRAGRKPSDYESLEDKQDALADLMQEAAQGEKLQKHFQTFKDDAKEYSNAIRSIRRTPTDDEKIEAMGKKDAAHMTHQDWIDGDAKVRRQNMERAQIITDSIQLQTGINPLRGVGSFAPQGASGAPPPPSGTLPPPGLSGVPTAAGVQQNAPPVVQEVPAPTGPFAELSQKVQQNLAAPRALAEKNKGLDQSAWEKAKTDLLNKYGKDIPSTATTPGDIVNHFKNSISPADANTPAFTDSAGRVYTNLDVIETLADDPRVKSAFGPVPIQTPRGNQAKLVAPITRTP